MTINESKCTAKAQLAEALGLLSKVRFCGVLTESGPEVEQEIVEFLARHAQAEQQEALSDAELMEVAMFEGSGNKAARRAHELGAADLPERLAPKQDAQGAQVGDERAAFERWAKERSWFDPQPSTKERDDSLFCYEEAITDHNWIAWQARAALATQPAAGEPAVEFFVEFETLRKAMSIYGLAAPGSNSELGALMERYAVELIEAVADRPFPYPPAAAHGDEAVRFERADVIAVMREDLLAMSGDVDPSTGRSEMECRLFSWLKGHGIPVFRRTLYAMRAQGDGGEA